MQDNTVVDGIGRDAKKEQFFFELLEIVRKYSALTTQQQQ